jgi:cytoskeletal protein RodZ|tara:strand:+ start:74 stop:490 length:417 start_codon:yes stop_codon:yes gene_type:complete
MEKTQNFATAIKQLRKSKGFTLEQISDSCKIKKVYLERMESGDFSFKPEIYIKLFLREYLRYIDLDKSESIMQEFNNMFNSQSQDIDLTFMPPVNNQDDEIIESVFDTDNYDPKRIATIIMVIIIIIMVYQFISSFLI